MNLATWAEGAPVLADHAELNALLQCEDYHVDGRTDRILELLDELGILAEDEGPFVRLRKIRGRLLKRGRDGGSQSLPPAVLSGSVGWSSRPNPSTSSPCNTPPWSSAHDVDADVMGVVEAEGRPTLRLFTEALLKKVEGMPYDQVMLVDGNDRGIDVGLLARRKFPLLEIRSHVFDTDTKGVVFSRDCCEYHLGLDGGEQHSRGTTTEAGDTLVATRGVRPDRTLATYLRA